MRTRCLECGTTFEGARSVGLCSDECRAKREARKADEQNRQHKKLAFEVRKCPDCGKPITDYRCPKCWAKRRVAAGIPVNGESLGYSEYDV